MNSWIDELTMASYESEIDLDRDVPNGPIEEETSYLDSLLTTGFDVDVDENGPFITAMDEAELELDVEWTGLELDPDFTDNEHEYDFDSYCDDHPDFNAALNGHPDYI